MIAEDVFQAALDDNPDAHGLRLVFADWLAEQGDERCDGMRWLGVNGKRPRKHPEEFHPTVKGWHWTVFEYEVKPNHMDDGDLTHRLYFVSKIMMKLCHIATDAEWDTRRAAEDAFCAAFLAVQQAEAVAAERSELAEMEERLQRNVCKCDGGGTVCGNCRDERDVVELRRRVAQTPAV